MKKRAHTPDHGTIGSCPKCGATRTVLRIRAMIGAQDGEDVLALVGALVALRDALKGNPRLVPEDAPGGRPGASAAVPN
jgi:hypothetical protein